MKILSLTLSNFASYKELGFTFNDKGVALIHGATGSGKSTFMDAPPWILFGKTSKGCNADEVISWNEEQTKGVIRLEINGVIRTVTRERGPRSDLYLDNAPPIRGANLQDTQNLINQLLGFDYDMYMASAYYHEFSQTAQFFTTTSKNRRTITEQLVDLSLPLKLSDNIKINLKSIKTDLVKTTTEQIKASTKYFALQSTLKEVSHQFESWGYQQTTRIGAVSIRASQFDISKAGRIKNLQKQIIDIGYDPIAVNYTTEALEADLPPEFDPCAACGTPKHSKERQTALEVIKDIKEEAKLHKIKGKEIQALLKQLEEIQASTNPYEEQLNDLNIQTNPHTKTIVTLTNNLNQADKDLNQADNTIIQLKDRELNLELLSDAVTTLRNELVKNTIESLESQTNTLLQEHFENEIQINLSVIESDKLEVLITKDSNEASYTQLSKGQRSILKLCFGTAVMKTISKHNNLDIKQLFFDESLDGMDDINKLRSIRLFETLALEYDSIYIVEHSSEVKARIDQKYLVTLNNEESQINNE